VTALIPLYDECRARGLNVKGLTGWKAWQSGYWFRREGEWSGSGSVSNPPNCFINHHTATEAYTSNVKNSRGQTKANIWLGLARLGTQRMYSEPGTGTPEAHFACATAANYGNGACNRAVYEQYVWRDRMAPNRPSGGDNGYANKHGIGMEIIHPGTGGQCDPGVFELAAQINAAAIAVYGWDIARILDHRSSTTRKQDLNFAQKEHGYTINALRTRIAEIVDGTEPPPDPTPPPEQEHAVFNLPFSQANDYTDLDVEFLQLVVAAASGKPSTVWRTGSTLPEITAAGMGEERGTWGDATVQAIADLPSNDVRRGDNIGTREWAAIVKLARAEGATFV